MWFFFFLPLQFLTPIFSVPESETGQEMEDRYDREMVAEGGCTLTMAAARSWADMEPSANCDDGDDVPIAQQLGNLPRLQKSGDTLPPPPTLTTQYQNFKAQPFDCTTSSHNEHGTCTKIWSSRDRRVCLPRVWGRWNFSRRCHGVPKNGFRWPLYHRVQ